MSSLLINDTINRLNNSIIVNDSILNTSDHVSSKSSLEDNDLNQLEKDISNIMKSNKYNIENNKTDAFKELILSLHGHITLIP